MLLSKYVFNLRVKVPYINYVRFYDTAIRFWVGAHIWGEGNGGKCLRKFLNVTFYRYYY